MKTKLLISSLSLFIILSCGGGGDSGDDSRGGGNNPDGNTLNAGITGKLFFEKDDDSAYMMDAETGEYYLIPNTNWESQTGRFGSDAGLKRYIVSPVKNSNNVFLLVARGNSTSYVAMQDFNGNYLGQIRLNDKVYRAIMSQDHQYVALFRRITGNGTWLEIYRWDDGTLISSTELDSRQLFWLQDNSLLYSDGRTLYFTKPASTEVDHRLTLPDTDSGFQAGLIGDKSISQDEMQIAFVVAEDGGSLTSEISQSRLYMVNSDGSSLRQVATTYGDKKPRLLGPQWSPDGRWLYVEEGLLSSHENSGDEYFGDMYLIPTENIGKVLYLSTNDSEMSPEVRRFWRNNTLPGEPGGVTGKAPPGTFFWWLPD